MVNRELVAEMLMALKKAVGHVDSARVLAVVAGYRASEDAFIAAIDELEALIAKVEARP